MPKHHIVFTPSGKRGDVEEGLSLLEAGRALGVDIDSVCGGRGICGRCQITVSEGDFPKFGISSKAEHLPPLTEPEQRYDQRRGLKPGRRLSCHCKLEGDIVIDVPPESQVHKQVVRKAASTKAWRIDPLVQLYYLEVEEASMERQISDLGRIKEALQQQWSLTHLSVDSHLLQQLQDVLREADWKLTAAVYDNGKDRKEVIAVFPGLHTKAYGMAVDIGSTTIATHLADLTSGEVLTSAGMMNPQIRFGEDLMSRVSYVMMHPHNWHEMVTAVREAINDLIAKVAEEASIAASEILDVTLVGNPVMHHLLLGINPTPLGGAPFALATDEALTLKARDLDLKLNEGARAYVLPCIAGHVGADTAGMILSEKPFNTEAMTLLVDVGTNAEIVLGNKYKLAACSSPTGPALEGAQISAGQRAAPGAIERVRIDPTTLEPRFKIIGCDLWSDDPDFAMASQGLSVTGICGSGIIEVLAEMFLADIILPAGNVNANLQHARLVQQGATFAYVLHEPDPASADVRVLVTQQDIRAVQLAKAALFAGIQLLMDYLKVEQLDRIALAGAFGSHIDAKYAMILGLLPDCELEHVASVGNAAGDGALEALLSKQAREQIERAVREIEKIETALEAKFQDYFVDALAIPNKVLAFPKLESALGLPSFLSKALALGQQEGKQRRRRRRTAA